MTYFSNTLLCILFSKMHTKRIGTYTAEEYCVQTTEWEKEEGKGKRGRNAYLVIRDLALLIIFF